MNNITPGTLESISNSNEYKTNNKSLLTIFENNRKNNIYPFIGDIREYQIKNIINSHKECGLEWKENFKWEEHAFLGNKMMKLKHQVNKLPSGFEELFHLPIIEAYIYFRDNSPNDLINDFIQPYFDSKNILFKIQGWGGINKLADKNLIRELGNYDLIGDVMEIWILDYLKKNNMKFIKNIFLPYCVPTSKNSQGISILWKTIKCPKK